jgi:hypothetical protein
LRSQFVTSKSAGGRRYMPYVFTEHGTVMLASVINSQIAINVSIQVVRIFTKLRRLFEANNELAEKIQQLEEKYDNQFKSVFDAIRQLIIQEQIPRKPIGFKRQR